MRALGAEHVTGVLMHAGYLGGVWAAVKAGMGAGLAALLVGLQPVLTALWISARGGQVAARQWTGLALGLLGLLLVVWEKLGFGEVHPMNLAFALLALAAAVVWKETRPGGAVPNHVPPADGSVVGDVWQALAPLLARHRELRVHLLSDDALSDLVGERIDLALRFGRLPDSNWVAQRLGTQYMRLCASPAYVAARGMPLSPDDLAAHGPQVITILRDRDPVAGRHPLAGAAGQLAALPCALRRAHRALRQPGARRRAALAGGPADPAPHQGRGRARAAAADRVERGQDGARAVARILARQQSLITTAQADAVGVNRKRCQRLVDRDVRGPTRRAPCATNAPDRSSTPLSTPLSRSGPSTAAALRVRSRNRNTSTATCSGSAAGRISRKPTIRAYAPGTRRPLRRLAPP